MYSLFSLAESGVYYNFYNDTVYIHGQGLCNKIYHNNTFLDLSIVQEIDSAEVNKSLFNDIKEVCFSYLNARTNANVSIYSLGRIVVWPNINSHLIVVAKKSYETKGSKTMILMNEINNALKSVIVVSEYLYGDGSLDVMYTKRRRNKFKQIDKTIYSDNEYNGITKIIMKIKKDNPFFVFSISEDGFIVEK